MHAGNRFSIHDPQETKKIKTATFMKKKQNKTALLYIKGFCATRYGGFVYRVPTADETTLRCVELRTKWLVTSFNQSTHYFNVCLKADK